MAWDKIHQDMTLFLSEGFFKTAVIVILLVLIYLLKDRINTKVEASPIQPSQWDLLAAYKVYIPNHVLLFAINTWILHGLLPLHSYAQYPFLTGIVFGTVTCIPSVMILILFFIIIKRPFNVQWASIGIDFKSFTNKALPVLLFIITLYIIYVVIKWPNITARHLNVKFILLPAVLLTSIAEELLIRLILLQAFIKKMNIYWAALITSICWSFSHCDVSWAAHIVIVFIGLFLAWTYFKSKTILVPMTIHATTNVIKYLIY
jgi:membrane protease YdiL (CAAX protease family)